MLLELALIIVGVLIGLVVYARWHYGSLEKMGVKMVGKPWLIFGNTYDAFKKPGGFIDIERMKKFGPVYGVYEGREPQIHICDAELIRLITTKDAEYFDAKRELDFGDPLLNEMPDFLRPYEKWKAVRSMTTPMFTSAKMKIFGESMAETCEIRCGNFTRKIQSRPGHKLEKYDLRDGYFTLLTEMVSVACFGIRLDNAEDNTNIFVEIVKDILSNGTMASEWMQILCFSFPFLSKFKPILFNPGKVKEFFQILRQMMEKRKKSGEKRPDVVEMCLEYCERLKTSPEFRATGITEQTILFQGFVFFGGGQDQISTLSSTMIYYILANPSIEKRLYAEIDEFWKRHKGKFEHKNLSELVYLNACLSEAIRLGPLFHRTERLCTKEWENKEFGFRVRVGTVIMLNIWAANRNPKYFENPEQFNPERFMPGNKEKLHPYALHSFGHGNRSCIATRFAYDTLLLLNVHILKHFKFHLREDSTPEYIAAGPFFTPHMPFYFDVTVKADK